jgi:epoxyqueuosine reductase QueG
VSLKESIKNYAFELGADLVGFGSIDRCAKAPIMMSPQGVFPGAQTVIVMALHHPDACIERGGEEHPQEIGPYSVQYLMNSRLDEMSYRMATFVEKNGYGAVPIVSSNIWRYNQYKDLKAVFAPDISHIYMAVVAGLADIGFNGLALTPEYGARNRFVTVITDAIIEPDPLIPPGTVCDQCMLCRKHCPAKALSKEIAGEKRLEIADYVYRFPDKNLWRCSWGEHFDLDLDLEIPEKVTEQVILDAVKKHGIRSGEMGQCLKFCVPKKVRSFDRAYSKTPMRVHWASADPALISRGVTDRLLARLMADGAETVIVPDPDVLAAAGIDLAAVLPGAASAVLVAVRCPPAAHNDEFWFGAQYQLDSLCYDLTRDLETLGFRSLFSIGFSGSHPDSAAGLHLTKRLLAVLPELAGTNVVANVVVTRLPIAPQRRLPDTGPERLDRGNARIDLAAHLSALAREYGADLVGFSPVSRLEEMTAQLRPAFEGDSILDATDRSIRFTPWKPDISPRKRVLKTPSDWLPGAKSVLVLGLRFHEEVLRNATRPPAEAVGPYAFQTYVTHWLGSVIGYRLVKHLEQLGYSATLTYDVTGTDSFTANPRGPQPDLFSNRFAGVAAGFGWLTESGHLATPQFGIRQRCIAIVTDAPLAPSPLYRPAAGKTACDSCGDKPCVRTCSTQAIKTEHVTVTCEGAAYTFPRIDPLRCDWCKRYVLAGESGFKYLGSKVDLPAPAEITENALAAGLLLHDPVTKYRPVVAEPCVINCPLAAK